MKKLVVALTLVGAVMAGATAHAQEDSYNNGNSRTPTLQPPTTTPGASFTVTVGCLIGESITFSFEGSTVTVACADNTLTEAVSLNGTASATFTAPDAAGVYIGTAEFPDSPTESFSIVVDAVPATTNPTDNLPATGSDSSASTIMIASVLLLAGVGMFAVAQRRRRGAVAA